MNKEALIRATQAALDGDWEKSHRVAQDYSDTTANWLHAVLHKIEGDVANSHYWYARTAGKRYADYPHAHEELLAILRVLTD
jgi:hypothetical protein